MGFRKFQRVSYKWADGCAASGYRGGRRARGVVCAGVKDQHFACILRSPDFTPHFASYRNSLPYYGVGGSGVQGDPQRPDRH